MENKTDICIIGAGPAGATTALQLSRLGIACTVIDKAVFPRDKVCGDGLSGKVLTTLNRIDPLIAQTFLDLATKQASRGVDFVAPGRYIMHIPYKVGFTDDDPASGFVCRRMDFDNFLAEELRKDSLITFLENTEAAGFKKTSEGYHLTGSGGASLLDCRLLIVANGAHSSFSKTLKGLSKDDAYHSAGVRAYFKNVSGINKDHFIELHFLQELLPGYFWIFPLPGGHANVGLDMLSKDVSTKKINLRKMLATVIDTDPVLKERFKNAEFTSKIEGYGLPLAGRQAAISGDNYLIVGDAASMIDPLTGEGIGNAMYAGRLAAIEAANAIKADNFSAAALKGYDANVYRVLGPEFKLSNRLQKLARQRWLFNWLMKKGAGSERLQHLVSGMLYDVTLRKKLASPRFYIDLFFRR